MKWFRRADHKIYSLSIVDFYGIGYCSRFFFDFSNGFIWGFLSVSIFLGFLLWRYAYKSCHSPFLWVAFCAAVFISIGVFKVSIYKPVFNPNHFHHFYRENDPLQIELVEELKPSRYSSRYIGSVKKVNDRDVTGRIILKIIQKSGKVGFRIVDVVTTLQPLNEIGGRRNPGEFDYRSRARKKGVYDQITA